MYIGRISTLATKLELSQELSELWKGSGARTAIPQHKRLTLWVAYSNCGGALTMRDLLKLIWNDYNEQKRVYFMEFVEELRNWLNGLQRLILWTIEEDLDKLYEATIEAP